MHRERNHPAVTIRYDERGVVRRERGGTTDIGASGGGSRSVVGILRRCGVIVTLIGHAMVMCVMGPGGVWQVPYLGCVMVMRNGRSP
jgi:hypothetical protein